MYSNTFINVITIAGFLLAAARPLLAQVVDSTFDDGTVQGWTFVGDVDTFTAEPGGPTGSGFYLQVTDIGSGATTMAVAPPSFLGDWTGYEDSHSLSADVALLALPGGTINGPFRFEIIGTGGAARASFGFPMIGPWEHYEALISESSWTMVSGTWNALISDVTTLRIVTEFGTGFDVTGVDNVQIASAFRNDWYTIDGGGISASTGGQFELSGTIGQHDAGPISSPMTGGVFELTSGFWVGAIEFCSAPIPAIDHVTGGVATAPCSGYIDPRIEGDTSAGCPGVSFGVTTMVVRFNTDVFKADGSTSIDADDFTIVETGGGFAPSIISAEYLEGDRSIIRVQWDRPVAPGQWTTIIADVYNDCGNAIESNGDLGPGVNEPDRIDIAAYPGDIDQNGDLAPFDVLAYRQFVQSGTFPAAACSNNELFYFDIDRNGAVEPFDLLKLRQLINFGCTENWADAPPLQAQP